jgi:hypothetical protein
MLVSGGRAAYLASIANRSTGKRYDLVSTTPPGGARSSVMLEGRQQTVPAELLVPLSDVLTAARSFMFHGQPDSTLRWHEWQGPFAIPPGIANEIEERGDVDGRVRMIARLKDGRVVRDVLVLAGRFIESVAGSEEIPFSAGDVSELDFDE